MFTTDLQQEMRDMLKIFVEDNRKLYGDHSFSAGFLESMVVQMLPNMTKRAQKDFISDIQRAALRSKTRLLEAQNENRIFERV